MLHVREVCWVVVLGSCEKERQHVGGEAFERLEQHQQRTPLDRKQCLGCPSYVVSQPGTREYMLCPSLACASICCVPAWHVRAYAASQPDTREYMLCRSLARASICCVTARHARVYAVS